MEDASGEGTSQVDPAPPVPSSSSHENPQGNNETIDQDDEYRASETIDPESNVDTAAPIDSVKGAVTKFGGILDWRERRVQVQDEIDKVLQEVTRYEKRSREAEAGKVLALQELESAACAAAELKLRLEKSQAELDVLREVRSARAELASLETERAASQEAEKAVLQDLAAELVALKGELESAHAAHGEVEEKRRRLAAAFEQDKSRWQSELEEAEQEAKQLREELVAACDLELKVEAASELLASLKAELLACTVEEETETETTTTKAMLEKTRKELDGVKESIEKAKYEADRLRVAAASMRDDLEREKAELAALQREDHDESKMAELQVREAVALAREEAGVAKAAVAAVEARLEAVTREILAANASEEMATASASALLLLQESEASGVTLTVEEYGELSRRARETEEAGGKRVVEAVKLIKEAKDAEVRSLERLARAAKQTEQRRQALEAATEEAEEAEFAKLSAERELRQWRAEQEQEQEREQEQQPRAGLAEISVLEEAGGDGRRGNPHILSPRGGYMPMVAAAEARQRSTFLPLPRMVMLLARKRAQSWK